MKILVISDSFKGSISSKEICSLWDSKNNNEYNIISIPFADGGEGSLDSLNYNNIFKEIIVDSKGPNFNDIKGKYLINNNEAFIEVSSSDSLNKAIIKDPLITTSFGVGIEIYDAINRGANVINLFLGGSASNDGGAGILSALKFHFYNYNNDEFIPVGGSLDNIRNIDKKDFEEFTKKIKFNLICDVNNVLLGENGASYSYGFQKGGNQKSIEKLDTNLNYYSHIINSEVANIKGSGAAGGIGYGIMSVCKYNIINGSEFFFKFHNIENIIKNVDYVISGEGFIDESTFNNKLVFMVNNLCKKYNKKLIILCGDYNLKSIEKLDTKLIYKTNKNYNDFDLLKAHIKNDYLEQIENILKALKSG